MEKIDTLTKSFAQHLNLIFFNVSCQKNLYLHVKFKFYKLFLINHYILLKFIPKMSQPKFHNQPLGAIKDLDKIIESFPS